MAVRIALQLYTVRRSAEADPEGVLRSVAKAGYAGVEFAGYYDIPAEKMKALLDENGLVAAGSHVSMEALGKDVEKELEYADVLGMKDITIPSLPEEEFLGEKTFEEVERAQKAATAHGISLSFHNHHREFRKENNIYRLDTFYSRLPGLKVELDTYWAAFAGADPLAVMDKYKSRLFALHIKDMKQNAGEGAANPNIGNGVLPIREYLEKAEEYGLKWAIVEMDRCSGEELPSVTESRKNLASWGY